MHVSHADRVSPTWMPPQNPQRLIHKRWQSLFSAAHLKILKIEYDFAKHIDKLKLIT
jgi:hypothetical protein